MDKELLKIVKKMDGSLLGIGIEKEKILDEINKNDKILTCFLLENNKKGVKSKLSFSGRRKKANIKKLKKTFGKKRLNNVICNYEYSKKFMRQFVPGSVAINNGKLYLYGTMTDEEVESVQKKYNRYTSDIEIKKLKDEYLIIVNNENTKNRFFKDKLYSIKDLGERFIDILTNLLIN